MKSIFLMFLELFLIISVYGQDSKQMSRKNVNSNSIPLFIIGYNYINGLNGVEKNIDKGLFYLKKCRIKL